MVLRFAEFHALGFLLGNERGWGGGNEDVYARRSESAGRKKGVMRSRTPGLGALLGVSFSNNQPSSRLLARTMIKRRRTPYPLREARTLGMRRETQIVLLELAVTPLKRQTATLSNWIPNPNFPWACLVYPKRLGPTRLWRKPTHPVNVDKPLASRNRGYTIRTQSPLALRTSKSRVHIGRTAAASLQTSAKPNDSVKEVGESLWLSPLSTPNFITQENSWWLRHSKP